jgi:SAM-dependent methyltransferase
VLDPPAAAAGARSALLSTLRCPECRTPMRPDGDGLACEGAGHRFPVVDGVPVLVDESQIEDDAQYAHQRRYFDEQFAGYHRYELERWRVSYLNRLREADALGGEGAPLVDVAVGGSGYTVIEAAREGRPAVGCDLSLQGMLAAQRLAEAEGVADSTLFVCCSAQELPFETAAFDVGLAIAIIEHVPDDRAALSELARVLRPGARAFITVPHDLRHFSPVFRPVNRRHDAKLGHLRRYSADTLGATCRALGLTPVEAQFTGHTVKAVQIAAGGRLPGALDERFWWWCERRDLAQRRRRRGSMQLSVLARRP